MPTQPLTRTLTIKNQSGLHTRPASRLVQKLSEFDAEVYILKGDSKVSAKSILSILSLAAGPGSTITVEARGPQAEDALNALQSLVENLFGERP